ncbi:MAG: LysR family transcriptional regulator [Candidatus Faecivicinus sp.]
MINRKIHYFVTLAECLSFTQTAAHYNVSQTAISQYISSLEERLGVRLFDRSQRTVDLTEAGKYYYAHVTRMLQQYDETLVQVKAISLGYTGSLKVGVGVYEYCSTEGFFSDFLNSHPEIKVDIMQYPYSELTEKLRLGELNLIIGDALCEDAFSRLGLQSRTLFTSPNYIVAAPEIAEHHAGDVRSMLTKECIITTCENTGPSSLLMLRTLFQDEFGFVPANISQTNSLDAQLMLVRARHGVAMVPGFIVDAQGAGLARFELPSRRMISYKLMCLKDSKNPAVQLFFDFV